MEEIKAMQILCAGGCGKILTVTKKSNDVFITDNGYFCENCAKKLPKHSMKKCFQCFYFGVDANNVGLCMADSVRKCVKESDDACEKYESDTYLRRNRKILI